MFDLVVNAETLRLSLTQVNKTRFCIEPAPGPLAENPPNNVVDRMVVERIA